MPGTPPAGSPWLDGDGVPDGGALRGTDRGTRAVPDGARPLPTVPARYRRIARAGYPTAEIT